MSALPPALRSFATVCRLDVKKGDVLAQQGTSGIAWLVQRTAWEQADFRDDIYVPRCCDAGSARFNDGPQSVHCFASSSLSHRAPGSKAGGLGDGWAAL